MKPREDAGSRLGGGRGSAGSSLGAGILQNFLGKASQVLASILLAAVLVRFLGMGPYGIWALLQFLVGSSMLTGRRSRRRRSWAGSAMRADS